MQYCTHWIPLEAEVAHPQLSPVVDLAERVEDGSAVGPGAQNGIVLDRGQVETFLYGLVKGAQRHDQPGGLDPRGGPDVPGEPDAIPVLVLLNELLVGRHFSVWESDFDHMSGVNCWK